MIYLKNPLCLGMEESEYKEMLSLGGMRQKHFEKNEIISFFLLTILKINNYEILH